MPSNPTHILVGLGAGWAFRGQDTPRRFIVLSALCSACPDIDAVGYSLGVPYEHFFGHRGFTHSLCFAFLLAVTVVLLFFRREPLFSRRWCWLTAWFFLVTASHDILDAFTNGGLGVALFSPFDTTRYFAPWTPIQVGPIGAAGYFTPRGLQVFLSEARWVWLPLAAFVAMVRILRKRKRRSRQNSSGGMKAGI